MIVRVRGVKKVRAPPSKGGGVYFYHRATKTRILAPSSTLAFALEVERLNAILAPAATERKLKGSLGALVAGYRASPEFARLAPRTRNDYQKVI